MKQRNTIVKTLMLIGFCVIGTVTKAQPVVSIQDSTINCHPMPTGKLIASVIGGTWPYSYMWYNDSWDMLDSGTQYWPDVHGYGTYHVVVTDDNSNVDTATVILAFSSLAFNLTPVEILEGVHTGCEMNNGTIEVDITGGQGPYCIVADWSLWSQAGYSSPTIMDSCFSGSSFMFSDLYQGDYKITVESHGGQGCRMTQSVTLEKPERPLLRLSGQLYPNGYYVSCDTCADARFTISGEGVNGTANYIWLNFPEEYLPEILVGGATLSIPYEFKEGYAPTEMNPEWLIAMGSDEALIESLESEKWYMAAIQDEFNCMDFKPLWIEKPRPATGAWHTKGNTADSATVLGTVNSAPLRLATSDTVRVSIASDGAVGIGTDLVPDGFLMAVNGKVIAEEVEVRLQGEWPDFVFEEGYLLPPLDSLKRFIGSNGHLPGFPSAREMHTRGSVASGQMVTSLVQKVEELTLYVIQLQEQVNALQQQGAQMELKVRGLGREIRNGQGQGPGNGQGGSPNH